MNYDRTLEGQFSKYLEIGGQLRWLFDYVKRNSDLDLLVGKNNELQWISIYRGLSRILTITQTLNGKKIDFNAAEAYKQIYPDFYLNSSIHDNFEKGLMKIHKSIKLNPKFYRYYDNHKEGYFQNEFSRRYGICGSESDDFVVIDKEAVVGYVDEPEKVVLFGSIQQKYKDLYKKISRTNARSYGKNLGRKNLGGELDFIALDKNGNILLIEFKHGTNTSGIYLSPVQIGMYHEIFSDQKTCLKKAVIKMFDQKQKIGLINPRWRKPLIREIVPVLIISNYNERSSAREKFKEIMEISRIHLGENFLEQIKAYNYITQSGLTEWMPQ